MEPAIHVLVLPGSSEGLLGGVWLLALALGSLGIGTHLPPPPQLADR